MNESLLDFRDDLLDFIDDHKKGVIITIIIIVVILLLVLVGLLNYEPTRITISNANPEQTEIIGTKAKEVTLKAQAVTGTEGNGKVTWETDYGKITVNEDYTCKWELPRDEGTYGITAKIGEFSATKYITVLGNDLCNQYKTSAYQIQYVDSDSDGLTDLYEGSYSNTNGNEADSDGDGLLDGDEIVLGLDPKKEDSLGDGKKDGERVLEYTYKDGDVTLELEGKGNLTKTSVDLYSTETTDNVSSILAGVYSIYTDATLSSAKVTIKYDKTKAQKAGLAEANLSVYSLDDRENTFVAIKGSKVDAEKGTITFETETLGKYFIADTTKLTSNLTTDLVFCIDNSGSMYSKEIVADSEENDVDFKRVDVVADLVTKLQGKYRFGVGKFTFEYKDVVTLQSDKTSIVNSVNSIKNISENFSGTNISAGIEGALKQFSDDAALNRRYIILLSDGKDTTNVEGYDKDLLKNQLLIAKEKNVKIYTVGLGSVIDEENLKNIAEETNGKYYFASNADDLEVIFGVISAELNYNLYDTDNDDIDDSIILADSGFLAGRDGFSFANFANTQVEYGYNYGMALFAKLFYEGNLPEKLGATKSGNTYAPACEPSDAIGREMTTLRTYKSEPLDVLVDLPDDFWGGISSSVLQIKDTEKAELAALGFTTYETAYNSINAKFRKYQAIKFDMAPYLGEETPQESPLDESDITLFRTLARLDITKYRDEKYLFIDNQNDSAMNELIKQLKDGKPTIIRINDDYAVLATKLLADRDNMNKYKIEVYDPNYAGAPKYIEVQRTTYSDISEISKVESDRYEYKFKYQGNDIGICISEPNVIINN